MALTKEDRDALPDSSFAVPGKRALPIPDEVHVRMAWNMLDRTKGLTESEKSEAKRRILHRAKELGIDTSSWEAHESASKDIQPALSSDGGMHAMHFEAMALDVPTVPDHPNRIPFSGVLTRLDQPSDAPVGGASGKRVIIPTEVAEKALASLLGMGVDYAHGLSGHDATRKIGVITAAVIEGNAIKIEGFLYGADFPAVVAEIQKRKSLLGFSYEAQASVADWNSDPVEVTGCVFTGAAILFKDKAAYKTTSLEARASKGKKMELEELMQAVKALTEQNAELVQKVASLEANSATLAAGNVLHRVKPHADRIRAAADEMEKDGMGGHERHGHVVHLRRMADKMEAEAILGKLPHLYRDHDWIEAAANPEVEALKAEIETLKKQAFQAAQAPTKPTEAADKAPLSAEHGNDVKAKDAELKAQGASITQRLAAITLARVAH